MRKIIETNEEISKKKKKSSSSRCLLERTLKMNEALEKLEFCFDDAVISKVLSVVIMNFLSTRQFRY